MIFAMVLIRLLQEVIQAMKNCVLVVILLAPPTKEWEDKGILSISGGELAIEYPDEEKECHLRTR